MVARLNLNISLLFETLYFSQVYNLDIVLQFVFKLKIKNALIYDTEIPSGTSNQTTFTSNKYLCRLLRVYVLILLENITFNCKQIRWDRRRKPFTDYNHHFVLFSPHNLSVAIITIPKNTDLLIISTGASRSSRMF